ALFVTMFSTLTGKLVRTLRSTLLSEPFDAWASRSTFCVDANAVIGQTARIPASASVAIRTRNMPPPMRPLRCGTPCGMSAAGPREPAANPWLAIKVFDFGGSWGVLLQNIRGEEPKNQHKPQQE